MTLTREKIIRAVVQTKELPSLPEVVMKLESELAKPEPAIANVGRIVEEDPALAARFLKMANSVFYARGRPVTSIAQAVSRIGLLESRRLTMATSMLGKFNKLGGKDPKAFWIHSIAVALTTRTIAKFSDKEVPEEILDAAYTAGLLHDLGVIIMFYLFPKESDAAAEELEQSGGIARDLELSNWGIHHGEVGQLLGERWELPAEVCQAIRYHHEPWEADEEHRLLVQLVHLANFVCNNQGLGRLESGFPESFDATAWEELGLSLEQVPEIIVVVKKEGEKSSTFWDVSS